MKVLFDTNILIAAFLTEGLCWKLLIKANKKEFLLFTSPYILNEFKDKLSNKFGFSQNEINEAINLITEIAEVIDHKVKNIEIKGICRDKKDDTILACAVASDVDYLVTGDIDLLILKTFKEIKILSPREFEIMLVGKN